MISCPGHPDINFPVVFNVFPVPLLYLPVHGDAAHHNVDSLLCQLPPEVLKINIVSESTTPEEERALKQEMVDSHIKSIVETRMKNVEILMSGLQFSKPAALPCIMGPPPFWSPYSEQ